MDKKTKIKISAAGLMHATFFAGIAFILVITMPTLIGAFQMRSANEAAFRNARERAAEIEEMVIGLTGDEVSYLLGISDNRFLSTIGMTRIQRHPDVYQMWHDIGWYYEWNSRGQNFRQRIQVVIETDGEGETMASTYLIKQVNSSDFRVME